jgi:hypothetical protein
MNCPKCGAVQAEQRPDCATCGVIFVRFRALQERTGPGMFDPSAEAQLPTVSGIDGTIGIPQWAVAAGVALLIILGIAWTAHRRATRNANAAALDKEINGINQKGSIVKLAPQQRLAESRPAASTGQVNTLPSDLTEGDARRLIEEHASMATPLSYTLPKQFEKHLYAYMLERYPALFPAVRDGLVEFNPPLESIYTDGHRYPPNFAANSELIYVHLTASGLSQGIIDGGDSYVANLGSRRVTTIGSATSSPGLAQVQFGWTFTTAAGNTLGYDADARTFTRTGSASFAKQGSWHVTSMTVR